MEHYKSTLATAAIAAFGLVAAAHVLHPGNFERTVYPSRPVAVAAAPAAVPGGERMTAWVNPPASLAVSEMAAAAPATAEKAEVLPVAWTSARVATPAPAAEAAPAPEPRRKVAAHRRRVAHAPARQRQAALDRQAVASPATPAAAKPQASRIDPIGDIIRGLGFGSDS